MWLCSCHRDATYRERGNVVKGRGYVQHYRERGMEPGKGTVVRGHGYVAIEMEPATLQERGNFDRGHCHCHTSTSLRCPAKMRAGWTWSVLHTRTVLSCDPLTK